MYLTVFTQKIANKMEEEKKEEEKVRPEPKSKMDIFK